MTSVAEGGQRLRSRGRLLWVALALSLTLNVFFVGGLVWSRVTMPSPETPAERFAQIGRELGLSPDQRDSFQQFIIEVRKHTRQLREMNQPLVAKVWNELGKAQPDQGMIATLVDKATENRHAYQKEMTAALSRFLAELSPDQRAKFVELAKRPRDQTAAHLRRLVMP
jgi:uncharacterized membrane protein